MHRIDSSGHVLNRFSAGNPAAGQLATRMSPEWCNDVQENIAYMIEQVGIALVKGDETQLYDAMVALIASIGGGGGGGGDDVPVTRLVNAAGLATGGGALATDITITVPKATAAEVAAGVIDNKAITPLGLADAMGSVKAATGYTKLFNGFMLQWGVANCPSDVTTLITMPTTFPTACVWAHTEGGIAGDTGGQDYPPFVSGRGLSTLSVWNAIEATVTVNWLALGY